MKATTGTGEQSDIALDQIEFAEGNCDRLEEQCDFSGKSDSCVFKNDICAPPKTPLLGKRK